MNNLMPQNPPHNPNAAANGPALTPELVKQVADKVYAMLQADLRLEWERRRAQPRGANGGRGLQGGRR